MGKRFTYKSRQTTKIKMRTVLIVGAATSVFMIGFFAFIFNLFENETSVAGTDPMVISDIIVFQDTLPVLKGTAMQVVLGVNIKTKGNSQRLNFSGMEISARGTSKPAAAYAGNVRMWSTGSNDFFIPAQQLGVTIPEMAEENFRVDGKQKLLEGDNYFWITFDVNQVAGSKPCHIDAECISIQIGTLTHEPSVAAPPGSKRIQNNVPYYSNGSGDISSLDSWNSARDGSGKRPTNFNLSNATFHIQSGHILRNDLNACLTFLVIERNGVLLSASAIKSEWVEVQGGGTLVQEKPVLNPEYPAHIIIKNGGNYVHNNTGALPGKIKELEAFSNVVLNNYSDETFSTPVEWGNVTIDAKVAASTNIAGCFKTVNGNMEIRSTGGNNFLYTAINDTINISGDLVIDGGNLVLAPLKNNFVLNINKNFVISSGMFADAFPGKSPKGNLEFYPGTNIRLNSGEFILTGKYSFIRFREEFVTWGQEISEMMLPDVTVMPGCTLKLAGPFAGSVGENRTFTVSQTAMLECGVTSLTGKGTFRLEQFGSITTSHPEGLQSEGNSGSIQTKNRYFSSAGDYMYNGKSSPQSTGVFETSPEVNTVNQMTISKASHAAIVILQQDMNVKGRLIQERGSINKNSHKLETGDRVTAKVDR